MDGGMRIMEVTDGNLGIYRNLAQSYEGEFSALTGKEPGPDGWFPLDTELGGPVTGYLLLVEAAPAGIAAIAAKPDGGFEVREFYVVPCFRHKGWGMRFAHGIWSLHPGEWEVKQIEGADYAVRFWRKAIAAYGVSAFTEDRFQDSYWGHVTRQRFRAGARERASA